MFTFFSWVFFIVLIAVIWWRIHTYRKNRPQEKELGKFVGKSLLWIILALVICSIPLMATAPETKDTAEEKPKTHKVAKKPKKSKKKSAAEKRFEKKMDKISKKQDEQSKQSNSNGFKQPKNKKRTFSKADKEAAALVLLRNNFKGKAKVSFDAENKAFMITPTGDEFKEELLEIVETKDTDDWVTLTNSIDKLSRSLYKDLGLADFVSIANPDSPDKVLYSSLNGKTAYDFLND